MGVKRLASRQTGQRHPHYLKGVLLVVLGGFFISQSGVLIGAMERADLWQVQFYRSLAAIAVLFGILAVKHRGRLRHAFASGRVAMAATGLALAVSNLFYISSFFHTRAASVFFIISAQPFFTALIAWLALREPVRRATWLAMTAAMAGVGIMMWEGLGEGRLFGNLLALGAAVTFAAFAVALRSGRDGDMVPGVMMASVAIALISAFQMESYAIARHDLLLCLYMGTFQVSLALVLYAAGARYVPAAELMVLALTETILGPVWVWLLLGEAPTAAGFAGGAVVVGAVLVNALTGMRRARG